MKCIIGHFSKYMYFACDMAFLLITEFQQFHSTILAVLTGAKFSMFGLPSSRVCHLP